MRYLYLIIEFDTLTDNCRAHSSAVDSGICAYLHIIFYQHISDLRNFIIHTLSIRGKAKAVGTYYRSGMEDAIFADNAAVVNLNSRIESGIFADNDIIIQESVGINFGVCAYFHARFDYRVSTYIYIFADNSRRVDDSGRMHPALVSFFIALHQREEFCKAFVGVIHLDKCSFQRLFRHKIPTHKACRCFCSIYIISVFRVGKKSKSTWYTLFDFR